MDPDSTWTQRVDRELSDENEQVVRAPSQSAMERIDVRQRFDLLNRTGQGSMSKVWKAHDKVLGRTVCVKVLDKEKTAKFESRFPGGQEAVRRANLHGSEAQEHRPHPGIRHSPQGDPILVMELIDGDGLNLLVETHSPRLDGNRVNYLSQLADALEYLHKPRLFAPRHLPAQRHGGPRGRGQADRLRPNDPQQAGVSASPATAPARPTTSPRNYSPRHHRPPRRSVRAGRDGLRDVHNGLPWEKAASLQTLLSHMNTPPQKPARIAIAKLDDKVVKFLLKAVSAQPQRTLPDGRRIPRSASKTTEKVLDEVPRIRRIRRMRQMQIMIVVTRESFRDSTDLAGPSARKQCVLPSASVLPTWRASASSKAGLKTWGRTTAS